MDRLPRSLEVARGAIAQFDMPRFPDRCREILANHFLFLASPEACHQQDPPAQSGGAKRQAFVGGGDAEPICTRGFKSTRTRSRAVTVGVRFDDGANFHFAANVSLNAAEVVAQRGERN